MLSRRSRIFSSGVCSSLYLGGEVALQNRMCQPDALPMVVPATFGLRACASGQLGGAAHSILKKLSALSATASGSGSSRGTPIASQQLRLPAIKRDVLRVKIILRVQSFSIPYR